MKLIRVSGTQKIYQRDNGSICVEEVPEGKSMTQQQFKDQVDVNNIMKKYLSTGDPSAFIRSGKGVYDPDGVFSHVGDYQSALDAVIRAQDSFMSLDADVRMKFQNDPQKLMEFLADDSNLEESYSLGLRERPKETPDVHGDLLKEIASNTKKVPKKEAQE